MTTTPAPTDLDTLRKLIAEADLELPVQMDRRFDADLMCTTGTLIEGNGIAAVIHSEELALLVEAALNNLPALLDELAEARMEEERYRQEARDSATQAGRAIRQRDAAREELAKTRAELDIALPFLRAGALAEHHGKCGEASQWDIRRCEDADCLERAHLLEAHGLIPEEWGAYLASPATTAEPAAKQPITARWPRIPGNDTVALHDCGGNPKCCGTPGDHDEAEPADEPKAKPAAPIGPGGQPCSVCETNGMTCLDEMNRTGTRCCYACGLADVHNVAAPEPAAS